MFRGLHILVQPYMGSVLQGGCYCNPFSPLCLGVDGSRAWKTGAQGRAIKSSGVTDSCTLDSPPLPLKDVAPLQS